MTKSEKIKEQLKVCIKGKCPQDCEYIQVDNCWMALVGELLKEQELIKPTLSVDTWICSKCGHTLESQELIDDKENPQILVHEQYAFCPSCGQAVKWDESQ